MSLAIGAVVLAVYGWYMHSQGRKKGFLKGAMSGGATIAAVLVQTNKMSRREALAMLPFINDEMFDEILETVKNANLQSKK